jgi:putative DNA primase/helicase
MWLDEGPGQKAYEMSLDDNPTSGNGRATPKGDRPNPPTEPTSCLSVVRMSDIAAKPVNWLWKGWLALGKVHLMVGMPGVGKSYTSCDLAARITKGWPWPDATNGNSPADVLFLAAEDGLADTIRPRLDAHGADCEKVHVLRSLIVTTDEGKRIERPVSLIRDIERVDEHLRLNPAIRALVVDPISEYLPGINHNKNEEIRTALAPLVRMAEERCVAAILMSHFNKGPLGPAIHRAMGSVAFTAVARIAWAFIADQEDQDRVLMLPLKNNLHHRMPGWAYRIIDVEGHETGRLEWEDHAVSISADEALEVQKGKQPEKLSEAVEWLRNRLSAGCCESTALESDAKAAGITRATLWRAREKLRVRATKGRIDGKWWVSLPDAPNNN